MLLPSRSQCAFSRVVGVGEASSSLRLFRVPCSQSSAKVSSANPNSSAPRASKHGLDGGGKERRERGNDLSSCRTDSAQHAASSRAGGISGSASGSGPLHAGRGSGSGPSHAGRGSMSRPSRAGGGSGLSDSDGRPRSSSSRPGGRKPVKAKQTPIYGKDGSELSKIRNVQTFTALLRRYSLVQSLSDVDVHDLLFRTALLSRRSQEASFTTGEHVSGLRDMIQFLSQRLGKQALDCPGYMDESASQVWALAHCCTALPLGHPPLSSTADVQYMLASTARALSLPMGEAGSALLHLPLKSLAKLAWGMAKLGYVDPGFWSTFSAAAAAALADTIQQLVPTSPGRYSQPRSFEEASLFDSQGVANVLWACATIGHNDPDLLDNACLALELLAQYPGQLSGLSLSSSVWALAKLDHPCHPTIAIISEAVMQSIVAVRGNSQSSDCGSGSGTVGTASTLRASSVSDPSRSSSTAPRGTAASGAPSTASSQRDTANSGTAESGTSAEEVEACVSTPRAAELHARRSSLHASSLRAPMSPWAGMDPQALVNTAWGLAHCGGYNAHIFDEIARELEHSVSRGFDSSSLSLALWTFANVGHTAVHLMGQEKATNSLAMSPLSRLQGGEEAWDGQQPFEGRNLPVSSSNGSSIDITGNNNRGSGSSTGISSNNSRGSGSSSGISSSNNSNNSNSGSSSSSSSSVSRNGGSAGSALQHSNNSSSRTSTSKGGNPSTASNSRGGYPATASTSTGGCPSTASTSTGGYPSTASTSTGGYPSTASTSTGGYPTTASAHVPLDRPRLKQLDLLFKERHHSSNAARKQQTPHQASRWQARVFQLSKGRPKEKESVLHALQAWRLHDVVCSAALHNVELFSDQDMCNLLQACALAKHHHASFYSVVAAEVINRAETGEASSELLCMCAWAFAKLHFYDQALMESISECVRLKVDLMSPRSLSSLAWSFAELRHYEPQLFDSLSRPIQEMLRSGRCTEHDISTTALAYAQFNHYDRSLMRQLSKAAQERLPHMNLQHISNVLWALSVMQHFDEKLSNKAFASARRSYEQGSTLDFITAMQLFQAQNLMDDIYGGIIELPARLGEHLTYECESIWGKVAARSIHVSNFQKDVCEVLEGMGTKPVMEAPTEDSLFYVDVAIRWKGKKIAVEVDGPHHYSCTQPFVPLGGTIARWRCIEMRKLRVVSIPFFHWRDLQSSDAKQQYMVDALDAVLWRTHTASPSHIGSAMHLPDLWNMQSENSRQQSDASSSP